MTEFKEDISTNYVLMRLEMLRVTIQTWKEGEAFVIWGYTGGSWFVRNVGYKTMREMGENEFKIIFFLKIQIL